MLYFTEIKLNCKNIVHLEVRKCKDITHLKGVLQFKVPLYIYHFTTVLTSHPRSTVVLLDTGTSGTIREIYSEDANGET